MTAPVVVRLVTSFATHSGAAYRIPAVRPGKAIGNPHPSKTFSGTSDSAY
ncbi:MAG: hypothetical protein ACK2T3_16715 [Candidatus Promineifilaceae bacterium]